MFYYFQRTSVFLRENFCSSIGIISHTQKHKLVALLVVCEEKGLKFQDSKVLVSALILKSCEFYTSHTHTCFEVTGHVNWEL